MATYNNIKKIKIGNNIFNFYSDYLPLTGGQVTGPVTFGDAVTIDEATIGDLVVNGSASFANNISANTINGVEVGSSPKFTDTTYSSLSAASGGTALSLVTTGEKYTWNSKTSNTGTVTSITLTQGDGISIGSSGTAITTSGSRTIALATSGATAGSYGPSADASPSHSGTFSVPYVTVDKYGRITDISTKTITLPASGNTDTKVTTAALTSGTTYYPILADGANTKTRQVDSTLGGLKYVSTAGTTSAVGTAILYLGNSTASGTANNEQGVIRLYGTTAYYTDIKAESGLPAANRTIYVPSYAGTMYLTCTSTTNAVGGATTAPVYVDNTGRIQAVTSIPYSLLTGTPTIPTDTNTTYTLSGTLSSNTFTSTLTAGGSGSGTSTSAFTIAAGTGISVSSSGTTITITNSSTNTDTQVTQTHTTSSSYYRLLGSASAGTGTGNTTTKTYMNQQIYMQPSSGNLYSSDQFFYISSTDDIYTNITNLGWANDTIVE